jgi:hypothetical protein
VWQKKRDICVSTITIDKMHPLRKVRDVRKGVEQWVERFVSSIMTASENFIFDLKHMIITFVIIGIICVISIFLFEVFVIGGPFISKFLEILSVVFLAIYDGLVFLVSAINDVSDFFGGGDCLPELHPVSVTSFFKYADDLDDVMSLCSPFEDPWYTLFYPIKTVMSEHTCFWLRYLHPTLLRIPTMFLFGWTSYDPTPDLNVFDGNCQSPELGPLCFVLSIHFSLIMIVIPWYWIVMVIIHFFRPILMLVNAALRVVYEIVLVLAIATHRLIEKYENYVKRSQ